MPRWWTRINKRVFNPAELRRGKRPVLSHVGRTSGATYRTPLDAHAVDGGYVFILVYGSRSDWVRNSMAAGHARLTVDGKDVDLAAPREPLLQRHLARPQRSTCFLTRRASREPDGASGQEGGPQVLTLPRAVTQSPKGCQP